MQSGTRLGHFEVLSPLGRGGMGEVWKARDTKLGREVALKTLPGEFAGDRDRLARLDREARVLAALNHPNIAQIYGLEESGGVQCLVMELVEGETLADRLKRGALPPAQSLNFALQIAEALEAAHERGVLHRDLKPANIKVTPEERVKVLDFGLAKALTGETSDVNLSHSPTLSVAATQKGIILGTAAYMAPEQAKGRPVDKRADIWAFGCVLYEMLTAQPAFQGDDITEILAAVIKTQADLDLLPAETPRRVRDALQRCLEKDPKERYRDIGDVRYDLTRALTVAGESSDLSPRRTSYGFPVAVGLAVAVLLLGGFVASVWMPGRQPAPEVTRLTVTPPVDQPLRVITTDPSVAITPDGRQVVYNSGTIPTGGITVRPLDRLEGERREELPLNVDSPFLSPDGSWLGFDDGGAVLGRVALEGGALQTISALDGALRGASWSVDDTIVFATAARDTGLFRVGADGGPPEPLTTPGDDGDHFWPEVLPGGGAVLFTVVPDGPVGETAIALLDLETREQRTLIRGGSQPKYLRTGHIVYVQPGRLFAVPFDVESLEVRGNPSLVLDGVRTESNGAGHFAISDTGSLAYITATESGGPDGRLAWVSREGRQEEAALTPVLEQPEQLRLSPDGQQVALVVAGDVWVYDLAGRPPIRITRNGGQFPVWTTDGRHLLYTTTARRSVFRAPSDGGGADPQAISPEGVFVPFGWSEGGDVVAVHVNGPQRDVVRWSPDEPDVFEPVVRTGAYEGAFGVAVSPDGRLVAYASDRDGEQDIWVQDLPDASRLRRVSPDGGAEPVWDRSGSQLYYLENGRLMALAVDLSDGFGFSTPVGLFDTGRNTVTELSRSYDVAPDGRFLMISQVEDETVAPLPQIVLVLNWFEELRERVPVPW